MPLFLLPCLCQLQTAACASSEKGQRRNGRVPPPCNAQLYPTCVNAVNKNAHQIWQCCCIFQSVVPNVVLDLPVCCPRHPFPTGSPAAHIVFLFSLPLLSLGTTYTCARGLHSFRTWWPPRASRRARRSSRATGARVARLVSSPPLHPASPSLAVRAITRRGERLRIPRCTDRLPGCAGRQSRARP